MMFEIIAGAMLAISLFFYFIYTLVKIEEL